MSQGTVTTIVGHREPRIPKYLLGVYRAPDEVLRLVEDIQTIELILDLVNKLDSRTINDDDNESGTTIRRLNWILYGVRNKARDQLKDYLHGQKVTPRTKPQTMADIWELFRISLNGRREEKSNK